MNRQNGLAIGSPTPGIADIDTGVRRVHVWSMQGSNRHSKRRTGTSVIDVAGRTLKTLGVSKLKPD
jgi:hypothetical protein